MKKTIIAGVFIIVLLVLGYIGYRKVENSVEDNIKNLTPTVSEKPEEVEEPKEEQKEETKTEKNTEKTKKSPSKSTKKTNTKKKTTKKITKKTQTVSYNKSDLQQYAHDLVISYGWSEYDYECLIKLWNRESGWNPNAVNKKSGACGIPQSLPCNKMASEGSDYRTNGKTQIRWGLKYIKNRYGSPSKAWEHSQQKGWY